MEKLVIFDIDGTLFQALKVSLPAYQILFKEMGRPDPTPEDIAHILGEPISEVVKIFGIEGGKEAEEAFSRRVDELEFACIEKYGELFPGVYSMLEKLKAKGYGIALCSLGVQMYVEGVMEKTGISAFVDTYRFDNGVDGKDIMIKSILDELNPKEAIMVGDRVHDVEAAKANGLQTLGCPYGYASHEVRHLTHTAKQPEDLYEKITAML